MRGAVAAIAFVMMVATINHHVMGRGTPAHAFKNFFFFTGLLAIGAGRFRLDHLIARRRAATLATGAASAAGAEPMSAD